MVTLTIDARLISKSGVGRYIDETLKKLVQNKNLIIFCLINKSDAKYFYSVKEYQSISLKIIGSKPFDLKGLFEIPLKVKKTDVFWTPHFNSPFFCNCKTKITTIHDVLPISKFSEYPLFKKWIIKIWMELSYISSDYIITISNFSNLELKKYLLLYQASKTKLAYLGIDLNFKALNINIPNKRKKSYALVVGNLKPHKNLRLILDVFKENSNINQRLELVILGDYKEISHSIDINKLDLDLCDYVVITGKVTEEELKNYYKFASVFIFPSLYEGFGLPILEAMTYNLPIVSSDIEVLRELHEGQISYFNPLSKEELKQKLIELISLGFPKKSYSNHLKNFNWLNHSKLLESLMNER